MVKVGFKLLSEDPAEARIEVGAGNKTAPDWLVYCAWLSPNYRAGLELVPLLAHHSEELVGEGATGIAKLPQSLSRGCPAGTEKLECCRRQVKKRKSSMRARGSPRQALRPVGGKGAQSVWA